MLRLPPLTAPALPDLGAIWVFVILGLLSLAGAWVDRTPAPLPERLRSAFVGCSAILLVFGTAGSAAFFAHEKSPGDDGLVRQFVLNRCGPRAAGQFDRQTRQSQKPLVSYRDLRPIAADVVTSTCDPQRRWTTETLRFAIEIWCDDETLLRYQHSTPPESEADQQRRAQSIVSTGTCADGIPFADKRGS